MVPDSTTWRMLIVVLASVISHAHGATCFAQKPQTALLTLKGHTDLVRRVAFSPDGKRLASASTDGTVKVWDATTGEDVLTFKGHKTEMRIGSVWSVAFSPEGKWVASASWDETVKLWHPATGKVLLTLKHPNAVYSMAVSPDGKRVATGSRDKRVRVWDPTAGKELLTLKLAEKHGSGAWTLAFSPDGKRLVSSDYGTGRATVWNVTTGKALLTLKGNVDTHELFNCVTFRPDGKLLASAGGADDSERLSSGVIVLWDPVTWKVTRRLKTHDSDVYSVAFSPDGKRLASSSQNGTIKVWDVSDASK